jgi:uncharacterized membrane protein
MVIRRPPAVNYESSRWRVPADGGPGWSRPGRRALRSALPGPAVFGDDITALREAFLAPPLAKSLDTHGRALAKAVSWRAVGTADTFLWSWLITGHPAAAGAIASLETFTKIALFYLHERLWRLVGWAPNARLRSVAKAVSWRLVGSIDTFGLSLLVTGNVRHAASIASVEALTKIGLYYLHERVWRRIAWGRLEAAEAATGPLPQPASK